MVQRRIDHLVVAVHDLERAAGFYRGLGFQVGARNRHPWGTQNYLIQFPSSFIEIIALGETADIAPHSPGVFSFGAFVRDYLSFREGLAMLVLDSPDADADARDFAAKGIGAFEPFFFERTGRRPDGSETKVAFTLAFARDEAAPSAGFFVCQQHFPENFWNPAFQVHDNGASGLSSVALAAPNLEGPAAFLSAFTGVEAERDGEGVGFPLKQGRIDLMTPQAAGWVYDALDILPDQPSFAGFTVQVEDLQAQARRLDAAGIPYSRAEDRILIPASAAFGTAIAFAP